MNRFGCAVAIALVLLAGACSSHSSGASAPSTAAAGGVHVRTFAVPATVACGHATSAPVVVRYAISGARRWQVAVDGLPDLTSSSPAGHLTVRVHCDGLQHTVALVASDAAGARTSAVRYLVTQSG